MQLDEQIKKCVVFVGAGSANDFAAIGTGFFAYITQEDRDFFYVLSAAHVVWPERKDDLVKDKAARPSGKISLRINRKNNIPKVISTWRKDWIFPDDPTSDLCAFAFDFLKHDPDKELDTAELRIASMGANATNKGLHGLSLGDEVFMPGVFVARIGDLQNLPVVRFGNIAQFPEEPHVDASPNANVYLIEMRSLGGFSGSPVFVNLETSRHRKAAVYTATETSQGGRSVQVTIIAALLIGMLLGGHRGKYIFDFLEDQSGIKFAKDSQFASGLAVVMTYDQIMEFLMGEKMQRARQSTVDHQKAKMGYSPDAAKPAPSTTEDNPLHKEAFTSLLGAAARKKPQADKT